MRSREERDRLAALFLAGEASASDRQALLEEIRSDDAFAREVAQLLLTERLLASDLGSSGGGEGFAREVVEVLRGETASPEFSKKVLDRVRRRPRYRPERTASRVLPFALAAAALFAVALLAAVLSSPKTPQAPPVVTQRTPEPEPPPPEPLPPPKPLPEEKPSPPPPPPPRVERPVVPSPPPPPREDKPAPPPPPEKSAPRPEEKTAPEPPRSRAVAVADVQGALFLEAKSFSGGEISRTETLATRHRRGASFAACGARFYLEKNSAVRIEETEGGPVRVQLLAGAAFFDVARRDTPFLVRSAHAEAAVLGTAFQVELEDRRTGLYVLEGAVRLKNEKGEATVAARQRSTARAGEKPAAPARWDVEAHTAWRKRIAPAPDSAPFADFERGANRKLAGLVLAAPYCEGEEESGKLARATAERLDLGLALGHFYRDPARKIWFNVDRALEADVRDDGTPGPTFSSDRARKATAEYLEAVRAAAGAGPRDPVPMIVQFRNHYLDLEVCEVAWAGFSRAAIAELKAFYAHLLERHKPGYRLELRFQGVDDVYEWNGQRRKFFFTEEDARADGYLSPRHARNAAVFFVPRAFGKRPEDYEAYSKILGELIEFLYARRR